MAEDGHGQADLLAGHEAMLALECIKTEVEESVRRPVSADELDESLVSLGMESLAATELQGRLADRFGADIDASELLGGMTAADVARAVSPNCSTPSVAGSPARSGEAC